jgi:hypothetical protein
MLATEECTFPLLQALGLQNFALVDIINFNCKFTLVDFWNKYENFEKHQIKGINTFS